MKIFISLIGALVFIIPSVVFANNTGFLSGNIWYSKDPFFAGEKIRIYTAVFNSSQHDIKGNATFYVNGVAIDSVPFSVEKAGNIQRIWIDWTPGEGSYSIVAKIIEARNVLPNGSEELITTSNFETKESQAVVDLDTDKDGVGNTVDDDIDGDGFSNSQELSVGTDPLLSPGKSRPVKTVKILEGCGRNLIKEFKFSDLQAAVILEMKLAKLAGLERKAVEDELAEKQKFIADMKDLLTSPKKILQTIKAMQKDYQKVEENMGILNTHINNAYNQMSRVFSSITLLGQKLSSTAQLEDKEESKQPEIS